MPIDARYVYEKLFGMKAVERGILTEKRFTFAFDVVHKCQNRGSTTDMLMLSSVLKAYPDLIIRPDIGFVEFLLENKMLTEAQVKEVKAEITGELMVKDVNIA